MADDAPVLAAPATPAAPSPPAAAPPASPTAPVDPTASVTERGWDGWPTTPTPDYLIPRMGRLPVSSTVHFQTVAMTGLGDVLSPEALWARLREPLLDVAQRRADQAATPLVVTKARYGDLGTEGVADVTGRLQDMAHNGKLSFVVGSHVLGLDPAPGIIKSLSVEYLLGGAAAAVIVADGQLFDVGLGRGRIDATMLYRKYLQPAPATVADVADRMTADGLVPTDLDPDAISASMVDVLDGLLGFAPDQQLDPLAAEPAAMDSPAEGVILYHEQGWYARGLALGNLLHSVALAPGEVTQVAMTHWNHVTRASDSEQVSQSDSTAESDTQDRSVTEVQDSALREHTAGGSSADSTSESAAFGISSIEAKASLGWGCVKGTISGTSQSNGSSHTVSSVVTRSDGDKNLAMEANQQVNATTRRHAEAARTRRATVVREVSQSEDEQLTTRVVTNYNHMHALTVMYFEVIEVYSLRTRVVDAERVVFLPFVVHDVKDLIPRFRSVLIDAANAAGRADLAEAIRHFEDDLTRLDELKARLTALEGPSGAAAGSATPAAPEGEIAAAAAELVSLRKAIDDLPGQYVTSRATLEDKISNLNSQRVAATGGLVALNALPDTLRGVAVTSLQAQLKVLDAQIVQAQAAIEALALAEGRARARLEADRAAAQQRLDALKAESRRLGDAKRTLEALLKPSSRGLFHDNRLFFNQAVWLSLSPSEVLGLARRRKTFKGEMLCETIDPAPVAISGNFVAYRWRFDDPVRSQAFKQRHVDPYIDDPDKQLSTVQADVAVPTGGVFGEAVLGRGVSAEKIDLSRFWNWKDSMIPILPTSINPLTAATPTPQNLSAEPGRLDESSAKLGALQDLPAPSGFAALAQTMQAQIFRDMSGQGMLQALAEATTKAAASSEQGAAERASQNLKAGLNFMSDMAAKALQVAAAPETGGGSLLGGMVASKGGGGGASLLGGVLNAHGAGGNGDLLSKLTGGKGGLTEGVEKAVAGAAEKEVGAGAGAAGGAAPPDPHIPEQELEEVESPVTPPVTPPVAPKP